MNERKFAEGKNYTRLWIDRQNLNKAKKYHGKFFTRLEKNIKHHQQIQFIKKYLIPNFNWLDATIRSSRLMDSLN